MIRFLLAFILWSTSASAEAFVAVRTIPAQGIIAVDDIVMKDTIVAGGVTDAALLVGMEARVALFAGRPIRVNDVGPPAVVQRNEVVQLIYETAGLMIKTDGRALERASPGDYVRVMNLASRTTVTARVDQLGVAYVSN